MFPVRKNATAKQVSRCPRVHVSLEQLPLKGGGVLLGGSLCKFTFNSRSRLAPRHLRAPPCDGGGFPCPRSLQVVSCSRPPRPPRPPHRMKSLLSGPFQSTLFKKFPEDRLPSV